MTNQQAQTATKRTALVFLIVVAALLALVLTRPTIQVSADSVIVNTTGIVATSTIFDHQGVSTSVVGAHVDYMAGIDNGRWYTEQYAY